LCWRIPSTMAGVNTPLSARPRRPAEHCAKTTRRPHRTTQCPVRQARASASARSSQVHQTVGSDHPTGRARPGGLDEMARPPDGRGTGAGQRACKQGLENLRRKGLLPRLKNDRSIC
jgi:hypothetical protein